MLAHTRSTLLTALSLAFLLMSCGINKSLRDRPDISAYDAQLPERITLNDSTFTCGSNHLLKNDYGLWELSVHGNPLEVGHNTGALSQELFQRQEAIFFDKIAELLPSKTKQYLIRKFLGWFNRKMYQHISEEYKTEILGLSSYAGTAHNYIAPPYMRILYLHGAHDIGHAVQDLALVGCTSFAVWNEHSADSSLLIGRNFDFYAGDAFAQEQMISFVEPDSGHAFMSLSWAGMVGVVSGMNEHGLTVTINAGHSKIPLTAKTPISLLTREILQYARTTDQALAIARSREVFVSESIMVGSADDKRAVLIEVSPKAIDVYEVPNQSSLVCSNHFQSDTYTDDKRNQEHILDSHSLYRYERMTELLAEQEAIDATAAVDILRNREGVQDRAIGYGNEKALNQLLAHHGIVFKPEERKVWVSTRPYQLGEFLEYDLSEIFAEDPNERTVAPLYNSSEVISADPFLRTEAYANYEAFRTIRKRMLVAVNDDDQEVSPQDLQRFTSLNPEYWEAHYLVGRYHDERKQHAEALAAYEKALGKEVTTLPEKEWLEKRITKLKRKVK